jgi:hypothetical protein
MRILDWILFAAVYFVASAWISYGIIAPIIVLRVSFPCTLALERVVRIDGDSIRKKSRFTLWFWGIIDVIIITLLTVFGGTLMKAAVGVAAIVALLTGLKKTGRTLANTHDYYKGNYQYIHEEDREKAAQELVEMSKEISTIRK